MKVLHLRHNDIDRQRWDATISCSLCDLPYAYSWYLDVVCPLWEALATEDYSYLMPLPLKKKWGIPYLIHPVWVQQLGIFSAQEVTTEIFNAFRRRIPYLVYDFNVNYLNCRDAIYCVSKDVKTNLIIPYNKEIDTIRKCYNTNTKRNISKAQKAGLTISRVGVEDFVALWKHENPTMRWDLHATLETLVTQSLTENILSHTDYTDTTEDAVASPAEDRNIVPQMTQINTNEKDSCQFVKFVGNKNDFEQSEKSKISVQSVNSVREENNSVREKENSVGVSFQFKSHLLGVYNDDQLVASLFGIQTRERFIYLIPVSNPRGKATSAMFLLVDYILENICCPQGLTFDCEGSMIPGVARFYLGFGAQPQPYAQIQRCHPKWLVRLFHK